MTLKEYFDKARDEDGELLVRFVKITDNTERTVVFSNAADVDATFDNSVEVSHRILKTINKNHDRIYKNDIKYLGCLVTFPEKITDNSNVYNQDSVHSAPNGENWQWRRLYIEQIIEVQYNGKVVWKNDGTFNFSLIGRDGEKLTVVTADEYNKQMKEIEDKKRAEVASEAKRKVLHKKAVELAKTLTEEDCSVDLGWVNGWGYTDEKETIKRDAILIKHDQLCHQYPEKHKLYEANSYRERTRGFSCTKCSGCGFSYSVDSSD